MLAGNVKVTVPFLLATVVYVNVNVLSAALHHTVALLNVTSHAVVIVISLHARDVFAIHTASLHVNVIVHDSHAFIYFLLGSHRVHTGFHVSLHTHVIVVAHVIVTVVGVVVRLVGLFHAYVQPLNTYPLAVIHIPVIVAVAPCLYIPPHATLDTHAHLPIVNVYVLLANHAL